MKTATYVKPYDPGRGDAAVYKLSDPMPVDRFGDEKQHTDHVVVSAVDVMFSGPETYIFPCDADGKVTSWGELEGSFRGGLDHAEALRGAGYEIAQ